MMVCAENGDCLELEPTLAYVDAPDFVLLARIRFRGFAAEVDTRVLRAAWRGFVQELVVLEERREGEAKLVGTSPEELSIVFRSADAEHMTVEGKVGARGEGFRASLDVSVRAFDAWQLDLFVREARKLSDHLNRPASRRAR